MKKTAPLLRLLCLSAWVLLSCEASKEKETLEENSKKPKALQVVENAIQTAGTLEKWNNLASIAYTKKSRLLLEDGQIESEVTQRHHYVFRPNKRIQISWEDDADRFLIVHTDSITQKFKNDSLIEEGPKVLSVVNASIYVLGMPFKLLDKGTVLTYEGLISPNTRDTVHRIKATYDPQKHQNHATPDVWWYHFDKNTGAFTSSMVYHAPTYALIENLAVKQKEGLIFPERRKSYRCDKLGNKRFLRAEFWYKDYDMKFLK